MQKQTGNGSRVIEILRRKTQRKPRDLKKAVIEIKNAFDKLISRPDTAEERIAELESFQNNRIFKNRKKQKSKGNND